MPKPIPPLIQKQIQRAILNKEGSIDQIAQRFGVSTGTVKRLGKKVKAVSQAAEALQSTVAIAAAGLSEHAPSDFRQALEDLLKDLQGDLKRTEPKSKEGVAGKILDIIKTMHELYPPTMADMVDRLLEMPDFKPAEFVQLLKERYAQKQAS